MAGGQETVEPERESAARGRRVSRWGLYGPFLLLALVIAGWSAAWFVIRNETQKAIDTWIAREASVGGRQWTCGDRTIGGYPFRVEVRCAALTLQRDDVRASVGPVTALAQIYSPRHIILLAQGPLRYTDEETTVEAEWERLEASVRVADRGLERFSLYADAPSVRFAGFGVDGTVEARDLEAHLRPSQGRPAEEGAVDLVVRTAGAEIPGLDQLVGGTEAADLELQAVVTQAQGFRNEPLPVEAEQWRQAGGRLEIVLLALNKGGRRLEAKGEIAIDELHRPEGEIQAAAAGIEGFLGTFIGDRGALGGLLGALTGRSPAAPAPQADGGRPLTPLPPLRLSDGRVFFGPLAIPRVRLLPLY